MNKRRSEKARKKILAQTLAVIEGRKYKGANVTRQELAAFEKFAKTLSEDQRCVDTPASVR